jgi:hypothetical protein
MLALFKGELSYKEFTRGMSYKEMLALRDARVDQLLEERKKSEEDRQQEVRNRILAK